MSGNFPLDKQYAPDHNNHNNVAGDGPEFIHLNQAQFDGLGGGLPVGWSSVAAVLVENGIEYVDEYFELQVPYVSVTYLMAYYNKNFGVPFIKKFDSNANQRQTIGGGGYPRFAVHKHTLLNPGIGVVISQANVASNILAEVSAGSPTAVLSSLNVLECGHIGVNCKITSLTAGAPSPQPYQFNATFEYAPGWMSFLAGGSTTQYSYAGEQLTDLYAKIYY